MYIAFYSVWHLENNKTLKCSVPNAQNEFKNDQDNDLPPTFSNRFRVMYTVLVLVSPHHIYIHSFIQAGPQKIGNTKARGDGRKDIFCQTTTVNKGKGKVCRGSLEHQLLVWFQRFQIGFSIYSLGAS